MIVVTIYVSTRRIMSGYYTELTRVQLVCGTESCAKRSSMWRADMVYAVDGVFPDSSLFATATEDNTASVWSISSRGETPSRPTQCFHGESSVIVAENENPILPKYVERDIPGPGPLAVPRAFSQNHFVESNSVSPDGFEKYEALSAGAETGNSEMMCLPVNQLHSPADSLFVKFQQGGGTNYIDEAIVLDREALELCPSSHPKQFVSLTWLGNHLNTRYDQLGRMTDREEAIMLGRGALVLCTVGHPDRSMALQLGLMKDLNWAIVLAKDALALCSLGHLHRLRLEKRSHPSVISCVQLKR